MIRHQSKNILFLFSQLCLYFKHTLFLFRISIDDVRSKLSSNSKNKKSAPKTIEKPNEEDSDDYELGKDLKDERKKKA